MQANAFARRYVRDSVERCRVPGATAKEVLEAWFAFGEDAEVIDAGEAGWRSATELGDFVDTPAGSEERDWRALDPTADRCDDDDEWTCVTEVVMPAYEFVTVDVFTERRFGGNPLAVFPDARGLTAEQMQALATEFNLSETTFVLPPDNPQHHAKVRIFTPRAELPFAGHPNVGTGYVLARRDDRPPEHYVFEEARRVGARAHPARRGWRDQWRAHLGAAGAVDRHRHSRTMSLRRVPACAWRRSPRPHTRRWWHP